MKRKVEVPLSIKESQLYEKLSQLNGQINTLFNLESLANVLDSIKEIISELGTRSEEIGRYWIPLETIVTKIINHIQSQTTNACNSAIASAKKRLEDQYYIDCSASYLAQPPDKYDTQYQLSAQEENSIIASYKFQNEANTLFSSKEFEALKNLLAQTITPKANEQKSNITHYNFNIARKKLEDAVEISVSLEMKQAGINLLGIIKKLKANDDIKSTDLPKITKYLDGTAKLINNPNSPSAYEDHRKNTKEAIGMNRKWGPIIGGVMLCMLGILLFAAAVTMTVLTCGASSPLTVPIAAAGAALSTATFASLAGFGLATTAVVGIGVASKAGMFAHRARKGPIAVAMEEVQQAVKAEKKCIESKNEYRPVNVSDFPGYDEIDDEITSPFSYDH